MIALGRNHDDVVAALELVERVAAVNSLKPNGTRTVFHAGDIAQAFILGRKLFPLFFKLGVERADVFPEVVERTGKEMLGDEMTHFYIALFHAITSFAGLRAHPDGNDFIIEMPVPGFINAAGIESPGLTASPAIGEMVGTMAAEYLGARRKERYIEKRMAIVKAAQLPLDERRRLIAKDPLYGKIVCRCEEVSEGEIVEAIRRGATTLDGVKRRVRAGMGRCQAGFCTPRVMEILSRELGIPMEEIRKNDEGSEVLV